MMKKRQYRAKVPQIKNAILRELKYRDIIPRVQTVRKAILFCFFDILLKNTGHVYEKLKIPEKNKFLSNFRVLTRVWDYSSQLKVP
jgi:hypothetical protein